MVEGRGKVFFYCLVFVSEFRLIAQFFNRWSFIQECVVCETSYCLNYLVLVILCKLFIKLNINNKLHRINI